MDDENQLVTEKIEKGIYFNDALSWYNTRYIFVQTQFSQMLIIAIIAFIAFLFTLFGFFSFLPITEKKLFVVYHDMNPDTTIHMKTLMQPGADPDYALSGYLLGEYVKSREEYAVERSERDFNYVYSLSGQNVLQDYLNFVSPDNPESPFVVYANRGSRDVAVTKVTFYDKKGETTSHSANAVRAAVEFSAQENFGAQGQNVANYVANVDFTYKRIIIDQKTGQLTHKPEMVITGYTTKVASASKS